MKQEKLIFWVIQICYNEHVQKTLAPKKKSMTKLDSILKSRDITCQQGSI